MATAADKANNTEELLRFINNLWQHQQKKEFCDFTLTTNDTSIECHKVVLSSASSYFSQLLCDSEYNTIVIDVTPLAAHILKTVIAFMYNSEFVINDENVLELLKISRAWNLDVLVQACVSYIDNNITINNACRFYNFVFDDVDQHTSNILNEFIRGHFTSLYESGQLSELFLKNFTAIIEHDEVNVQNEDVVFSSAVQIINQQTSAEDINRCLELIRFPYMSGDFLVEVILDHPLLREPPRDRYPREALLYQVNKTSTLELKPRRQWQRRIYYIGRDRSIYQYVSNAAAVNECRKIMEVPNWVNDFSSIAFSEELLVIVGGRSKGTVDKRALLVDITYHTKVGKLSDLPALDAPASELPESTVPTLDAPVVDAPVSKLPTLDPSASVVPTSLPNLPEPLYDASVVVLHPDIYILGGGKIEGNISDSVYHLSLFMGAWQIRKPMPRALSCPLVVHHQKSIFVLGGYSSGDGDVTSSVSQYNIEEDTWKGCSSMPVACDGDASGVVVHEDRIKVITVDKCLIYADDTDTWTVKEYSTPLIDDRVKAFVKRGQIWAAVGSQGADSIVRYDDVANVWKTELEKIDNALYTTMFF